MTPRQIVALLDEHIVGQAAAKRAVAIAIRNRFRRQQLSPELRKEVTPKNIIMIGPTGVGKTEITRRLAKIIGVPFIKVEATKYTEVGYHGRDVESMARDLAEASLALVKQRKRHEVEPVAQQRVADRLLDLLVPEEPDWSPGDDDEQRRRAAQRHEQTRERFRDMLERGELEERTVELTVEQKAVPVQILSNVGMEQMDIDFQSMFDKILPKQSRDREVTVREARKILLEQELETLLDKEAISEEALRLAEESGIIFLDEIDKICGPDGGSHGVDVSRQGVQRDLLPVVEGTTVNTRCGPLRTDHVLFIAAGAFHQSKPSDLMPELQGRFPIRVELTDLTQADFVRILKEPTNSLAKQYQSLLATDGVRIEFTDDAFEAMADVAYRVNQTTQNIGARRLHTILERLLEDLSFEAPYGEDRRVVIDAAVVRGKLEAITQSEDSSRFIL